MYYIEQTSILKKGLDLKMIKTVWKMPEVNNELSMYKVLVEVWRIHLLVNSTLNYTLKYYL